MGNVLVIANRKGGCGKSFTTASLAVGLARQDKKVLCIDLDNQHSLTVSMGINEPEKLDITITTMISDVVNKKYFDPTAGIIHHPEGVDIIPANNSLTCIELFLAPLVGREIVIKKYLDKIKHRYDYCLIDTGATLDLLTINALAAANGVIIPVPPKYLDARGLALLLHSIAEIREFINPCLKISGILFTMVEKRANITKKMIDAIEKAYGENIRIFKEHIPRSIRAAEACTTGKSIYSYDSDGTIAKAYDALAREVLEDA